MFLPFLALKLIIDQLLGKHQYWEYITRSFARLVSVNIPDIRRMFLDRPLPHYWPDRLFGDASDALVWLFSEVAREGLVVSLGNTRLFFIRSMEKEP